MRVLIFISLLFFGTPLTVFSLELEVPEAVGQGEPFYIQVGSESKAQKLTVVWLDNDYEFPVDFPGSTSILLGTGLKNQGPVSLQVKTEHQGQLQRDKKTLLISKKDFPEQRLTLPESMVDPPQETLDRIIRERDMTVNALNTFSARRLWEEDFTRPGPGSISSRFGVRRFLNDQPRSPHRGVDLRGAQGTPVKAMNRGRVVLTGNFYFGGRTVIIDHGFGLLTLYMHLSKIMVSEEDQVENGQILGLVGSTGRSTGPHLHLGMYILGQPVDPLMLAESNPVRPE